jgi:hypothetical protein
MNRGDRQSPVGLWYGGRGPGHIELSEEALERPNSADTADAYCGAAAGTVAGGELAEEGRAVEDD